MAFRAMRPLPRRGRDGVGAVGAGMVLDHTPGVLRIPHVLPRSPSRGEGGFKDSPAGRNGCSGFTLVELMVVVVLLAIAIGIVMPRINRAMFASDTKLATRQLAALVQVVRDRAMRSHRPQYRLNYDLNSGELWVTYIAPSGEVVEDDHTLTRRRRWPGRIRLVDVITQFQGRRKGDQDHFTVFLPSGYIERTLLHLTDGDVQFTLVIEPLTGRIERRDGFVEEIATGTTG